MIAKAKPQVPPRGRILKEAALARTGRRHRGISASFPAERAEALGMSEVDIKKLINEP